MILANLMFGLVIGLTSASMLLILYHASQSMQSIVPKKTMYGFVALLVVIITYLNFQTYGPRNSLESNATGYRAEAQDVTGSKKLFGTEKDRVGQFDDEINEGVSTNE